jgi:hypothetical protein
MSGDANTTNIGQPYTDRLSQEELDKPLVPPEHRDTVRKTLEAARLDGNLDVSDLWIEDFLKRTMRDQLQSGESLIKLACETMDKALARCPPPPSALAPNNRFRTSGIA